MKIVFMGTSNFGVIILEKLPKSQYKPNLVVTVFDKPVAQKNSHPASG